MRAGQIFWGFLATLAWVGHGAAQPVPVEQPVELPPLSVVAAGEEEGYDPTGMGSVEQQLADAPFANELIAAEDYVRGPEEMELGRELAVIAEPSPAERIAGESRLNLRGFPTPTLRNGFIQVGIPETLNAGQTIVIQGALVPVLGRAAPGGIQNFLTNRPRTTPQLRLSASASTLERTRLALEQTAVLAPKKLWERIAAEQQERDGPVAFTTERTRAAGAALTWRRSRTASFLLAVDHRETTALASPGIPEYRPAGGGRIAGPYLSLANFNANGPATGVRNRSTLVAVQYDGQPRTDLAVRAGAEAWRRRAVQDRFTTSVLDLATGLFEGTREPRHLEQPQEAVATHLEGTYRFHGLGAEQKLLLSGSLTWGAYQREERALPGAARAALPATARRFDPAAPDYSRPAFSPAVYARVLSDRTEQARYGSVELSDRLAWQRGRLVVTAGVRRDAVALKVTDRRPGAAQPRVRDHTGQVSHHAGANYQLVPARALLFVTTSTAFDPSTPVDARTGRIQDNETTLGHEAGIRGRAASGRVDYSASGFLLFNRAIARRNPLFNDPVADADHTQPQLVAAGEERFSGARLDLRWRPNQATQVSLRGSYTRAVTTASPDLPQEAGRALARLPALTVNANLRYRPPGPRSGWFAGADWQYVGDYVARYEDVRHDFLAYPGYGVVHGSLGYAWRRPRRTFELETGVRNLFDRDLLASNARVGAGREFTVSARLIF